MADYLDYGDPEGTASLTSRHHDESRRLEDEEMDVADEAHDVSHSSTKPYDGVKVYPYPAEWAIGAGDARRTTQESTGEQQLEGSSAAAAIVWDEQADQTPPEVPLPIGGGQDVRMSALHLTGNPISKLSTSRLFAYVTHYGAQPLGLEWINDTSVNVVFAVPSAARLALEYICPDSTDSTASAPSMPVISEFEALADAQKAYKDSGSTGNFAQWTEETLKALLTPRRAHCFPTNLYTGIERDYAAQAQRLRDEPLDASSIPEDAPDIYREMAAEERKLAWASPEMGHLKLLQGTIWARFALESADVKVKRAKTESKWYKEHGYDAGKEVIPRILEVGAIGDKVELLPDTDAEAQSSGAQKVRGRGVPHRTAMDELDDELEELRASRTSGRRSASPVRGLNSRGHGYDARPTTTNNRRSRGSQSARNDLDDEMDQWNALRGDESSSPNVNLSEGANGRKILASASAEPGVKVRGRGRHKAPSSVGSRMAGWSDETEPESRMASDRLEEYSGRTRLKSRGQGAVTTERDEALSTLAQRLGHAPGGPTLEERLQSRNAPSLASRFGS